VMVGLQQEEPATFSKLVHCAVSLFWSTHVIVYEYLLVHNLIRKNIPLKKVVFICWHFLFLYLCDFMGKRYILYTVCFYLHYLIRSS